jgi:hypothetical protein
VKCVAVGSDEEFSALPVDPEFFPVFVPTNLDRVSLDAMCAARVFFTRRLVLFFGRR